MLERRDAEQVGVGLVEGPKNPRNLKFYNFRWKLHTVAARF